MSTFLAYLLRQESSLLLVSHNQPHHHNAFFSPKLFASIRFCFVFFFCFSCCRKSRFGFLFLSKKKQTGSEKHYCIQSKFQLNVAALRWQRPRRRKRVSPIFFFFFFFFLYWFEWNDCISLFELYVLLILGYVLMGFIYFYYCLCIWDSLMI